MADWLPSGAYTGAGIETYLHEVLSEPGRTDDFRRARLRALPDRHRPRHLRAGRVRRRGHRRRSDLDRRAGLGSAADGLFARQGQGPRADRRRHACRPPTSTSPSKPVPSSCSSINPIVPFINDFSATRQDAARARALAASPTWASRRSATRPSSCVAHQRLHELAKGWEQRYPGRRHRADRAGGDRRAHVPDLDDELRLTRRDSPPRL